ncbi:MAG TPA: hypothetical protein EYP85_11505 [Armatimonadetes bacterium]|nr:hypothetical protein [Armatimonadota bacterium]
MIERKLILFEQPGAQNTVATLQAARERAEELGLKQVVVATSTGATALKAAEVFAGLEVQIIGVTLQAGVWEKYTPPQPDLVQQAQERGVKFLTATHTLMGNVDTAIRVKFGGLPPTELIAHTLYLFGQGMKVAIEVAVMAADAGLLAMEREVMAIAGTNGGADVALVLKPAYSVNFFDLQVREIVALPR